MTGDASGAGGIRFAQLRTGKCATGLLASSYGAQIMMNNPSVSDLFDFLDTSPTPYHAVQSVTQRLEKAGFRALNPKAVWKLKPGGAYFWTRRDASVIAFVLGEGQPAEEGLRIVGAHTDSPTLKVKARPERTRLSFLQLGIEVYGGVLLSPWFDRDLSLAGRVAVRAGEGVEHHLVDFQRPIAVIPNLAIHLDRNVNNGRAINPQEQMRPILAQVDGQAPSVQALLQAQLDRQSIAVKEEDILEFDLCFYDVQKAAQVGLNNEFVASARLDNLLSCFSGLSAFIQSSGRPQPHTRVLALFDHEEVGSTSDIGANSNMLLALIDRLMPDVEERHRLLACSTLLSVDNAHGIHPNYADKHDEAHGPLLNHGPVIKMDANQGYATSSGTSALIQLLAEGVGVPLQKYVTRADMRCGSTIGPMSAAKTGIQTVDLGAPTFAMHSIRELAGAKDFVYMDAILQAYLKTRPASL